MSPRLTEASVESITPLTDSILQLMLEPDEYIDYQAGQYLQILMGKEAFSYSIANAPLGSHKYELHIRHTKDNPYNQPLLAEIKHKGRVSLRLPKGECHLNRLQPQKPILFIAGGTGFAPIKAMIEQLLAQGESRAFELFWGARSQSDLYMDEKVLNWQSHVKQFQYFSLLSEVSNETLAAVVLNQYGNCLNAWQMVISGPFDMSYSIRDSLVAAGVDRSQLFSDAFDFEEKK